MNNDPLLRGRLQVRILPGSPTTPVSISKVHTLWNNHAIPVACDPHSLTETHRSGYFGGLHRLCLSRLNSSIRFLIKFPVNRKTNRELLPQF